MRLKNLTILTKSRDFQYNRSFGVCYFSKSVIVQVSRIQSDTTINKVAFGLIVSKKVGCSVKRNLIKRRLRMIAQKLLPHNKNHNTNYVFIARKKAAIIDFSELQQDVFFCLKKSSSKYKFINNN